MSIQLPMTLKPATIVLAAEESTITTAPTTATEPIDEEHFVFNRKHRVHRQ